VIDAFRALGLDIPPEELRLSFLSLQRLDLAFILGEDQGIYAWRVPLFRDRRRFDEPEAQIADERVALL
jgi:hypothetical protein